MASSFTAKEVKKQLSDAKRDLKKKLLEDKKKAVQAQKDKRKKKTKSPEESYYQTQFTKARMLWAYRNPKRKECYKNNSKKDEHGFIRYQCAGCKNWYAYSDIDTDHIQAIGKAPTNLEEYIECFRRLNTYNLQLLCKRICHDKKTKSDIVKIKENRNG